MTRHLGCGKEHEAPPECEMERKMAAMLKQRTTRKAAAGATLMLLASLATSLPAQAEDVVMFRDRVPSANELANLLWPRAASAAPAGMRTRSLGRTRSIRLDEPPPAPLPAAAMDAGVAQVASAAAVAPSVREPEPQPAAQAASTAFGFNIRFAFDSSELLPESVPYLDQVGVMLQGSQAEGRRVAILGHTDAMGAAGYNDGLSQRRALAVARYLEDRYGVAPQRLQVAGLGERAPLAGLDPDDAANRRVEFHAVE